MLSRSEIEGGLRRLGELATDGGRIIDIAVFDGTAMVLAWGGRTSTKDVGAIVIKADDKTFLHQAIGRVAAENRWPRDWLKDVVKGFVGKIQLLELLAPYNGFAVKGIRVFVSSPEYMFALKAMVMRWGESQVDDQEDLVRLAKIVGIYDSEQAIRLVENYYPQNQVPPKVKFGLEGIKHWGD